MLHLRHGLDSFTKTHLPQTNAPYCFTAPEARTVRMPLAQPGVQGGGVFGPGACFNIG